jgi:trimeric autotransporter adhesin
MHQHVSRINLPHSRRVRSAVALLLTLGAAACTRDALLSPEGARPGATLSPQITVTPGSAVVGDTGVVLTVRGAGFTEASMVWIDPWLPVTPTFVDDSTFSVRIEGPLQEVNTYRLRVVSESWEMSDEASFEVQNPAPVITRITPDWCDTGNACGPITLYGRDFVPGVVVQWNGSYINANRLNDSTISFTADWYLLQSPELVQVTAVNPQPGGGASAPVLFQVGLRVIMHTAGATAGSSGFELEIYGDSFSSGATVYWNGAPRQTTYFNPRRISAWIPASDVAAPGEGVVTLSTWQLNQGQPFRVGTITVRPQASPTVTSQLTLDLPVRDIVYSAFTDRLYATVYDGPNAGQVAVINPTMGYVEQFIWIGASPRYLAVSDDGRYLWVGVDGENRVRRVNLEYAYPDAEVQLDSGIVAEDLAAVPGHPLAVAIARKNTSGTPRHAGVAVYEGYWATMRSSATAAGLGSNVIDFGAKGSRLYGLDNETAMDGRYRTMTVDDNGVTLTSTEWRMHQDAEGDFVFAGGRLYLSEGNTIDTGYNDWAGFFSFTNPDGAVRPDTRTGRAFYLNQAGIRVGDINTFALLGTLPVPTLQFEPAADTRRHLVRWGADGLAFHDADQVFILRSPIVGS